jgi:hypothetical protein
VSQCRDRPSFFRVNPDLVVMPSEATRDSAPHHTHTRRAAPAGWWEQRHHCAISKPGANPQTNSAQPPVGPEAVLMSVEQYEQRRGP